MRTYIFLYKGFKRPIKRIPTLASDVRSIHMYCLLNTSVFIENLRKKFILSSTQLYAYRRCEFPT